MGRESKSILVIDDEPVIRTVIKKALAMKGYEIEVLGPHRSAIEESLTRDHFLVVLDLYMPGLDGTEVVKLLRERRVTAPVLVISSSLGGSRVKALRALGVSHFLSKPFKLQDLWKAVEQAISSGAGQGGTKA